MRVIPKMKMAPPVPAPAMAILEKSEDSESLLGWDSEAVLFVELEEKLDEVPFWGFGVEFADDVPLDEEEFVDGKPLED
jgi:hypothetical protein